MRGATSHRPGADRAAGGGGGPRAGSADAGASAQQHPDGTPGHGGPQHDPAGGAAVAAGH